MDQPALFLVEADEKLQSKFNSLPNEQMTYNLLSSFIVGYIFALRPNKDLEDFDFILNTITNLQEVKQNKKLTFSQFILVMEQIIIKHSQNIQEIVIQESNKFCEAQQSKVINQDAIINVKHNMKVQIKMIAVNIFDRIRLLLEYVVYQSQKQLLH
ncbi:hypothetical protein ABPG72_012185 [Tetrahymena utriculariae]